MSKDHEDGGPAFPDIRYWDDGQMAVKHPGMSLRDWFAGQALAAYVSRPDTRQSSYAELADWSYDAADAMLAARKGDAK